MKAITALILVFTLALAACGGAADPGGLPASAAPTPASPSCDLSSGTDAAGNTLWTFSAPLTGNPLPGACDDLQDGVHYLCNADACLFLPYTGTCPHCPGGGE